MVRPPLSPVSVALLPRTPQRGTPAPRSFKVLPDDWIYDPKPPTKWLLAKKFAHNVSGCEWLCRVA